MTLSEAFGLFERDYIREEGLSTDTEDNYRQALRSIQKVLHDKSVEDLTFEDVRRWGSFMESNGCTRGTIRGYKSKLKNVLKFTNKRGITSFDLDDIRLPKPEKKLPRYLLASEVEKMLVHAQSARDEAIISLLFSTGMRVNELVGLNLRDLQGDILTIRGKGAKEREIPLNPKAAQRLNNYVAQRKDSLKPMFVTAKKCRIAIRTVQNMTIATGIRAGITRLPVSPHVLRHSFGTDLHSNGMDIRNVQYFMGHENIATTQIYTHIIDSKARSVFAQCQTVI